MNDDCVFENNNQILVKVSKARHYSHLFDEPHVAVCNIDGIVSDLWQAKGSRGPAKISR